MSFPYTIGIAGSTEHTVICAEALAQHSEFTIRWVLTPSPRPQGRKQLLTPTPLQTWAESHGLPVIHVDKKIDAKLRHNIEAIDRESNFESNHRPDFRPDFVLVIDFGYIIPEWLLEYPTVGPINVHPSLLPRWRGSSPGQFVLLYGEKESAVTIMKMNAGLDTGPILEQIPLAVGSTWNLEMYYQMGFEAAAKHLPITLLNLAEKTLTPRPQPEASPTPIARRLTREDGYIAWKDLAPVLELAIPQPLLERLSSHPTTSSLIQEALIANKTWDITIHNAIRGLSPWPNVWTIIETTHGPKRMQLLRSQLDPQQKFLLKTVKIEGKNEQAWNPKLIEN